MTGAELLAHMDKEAGIFSTLAKPFVRTRQNIGLHMAKRRLRRSQSDLNRVMDSAGLGPSMKPKPAPVDFGRAGGPKFDPAKAPPLPGGPSVPKKKEGMRLRTKALLAGGLISVGAVGAGAVSAGKERAQQPLAPPTQIPLGY